MITETVVVYFDDLDAMGVVHDGRYAALLERALAAYGTPDGLAVRSRSSSLRRGALRGQGVRHHLSRTDHPDRAVQVQLARSPWQHQRRVRIPVLSDDGAVVHAEGRRVQVRLDPGTLRPAPISAELREACRPLLAPEDTGAPEAA